MSDDLSESQYLEQSHFTIPECFQIPLKPIDGPAMDIKKTVSLSTPLINGLPPLPVLPSLSQTLPNNGIKPHKKRVSAGMKMVREEIERFTKNSTTILTGLKECNVNMVPSFVESDVGVIVFINRSTARRSTMSVLHRNYSICTIICLEQTHVVYILALAVVIVLVDHRVRLRHTQIGHEHARLDVHVRLQQFLLAALRVHVEHHVALLVLAAVRQRHAEVRNLQVEQLR